MSRPVERGPAQTAPSQGSAGCFRAPRHVNRSSAPPSGRTVEWPGARISDQADAEATEKQTYVEGTIGERGGLNLGRHGLVIWSGRSMT